MCIGGAASGLPLLRLGTRLTDPRTRLLRLGPEQLCDAELLALLLGTGRRDCSAIGLGQILLSDFNGLPGVLDASARDLLAIEGLGPGKAAAIKAVLSLAERYERAPLVAGRPVTDAASAERFLRQRLGSRPHEVFAVMFLNARHQLLMFEELFSGSVDRAQVYPREVLRRALSYNAAAVVLAHNHPSGNPEPSASDVQLTERLKRLLAEVDVRVLDHLVVGRGRAVSLAERGLI